MYIGIGRAEKGMKEGSGRPRPRFSSLNGGEAKAALPLSSAAKSNGRRKINITKNGKKKNKKKFIGIMMVMAGTRVTITKTMKELNMKSMTKKEITTHQPIDYFMDLMLWLVCSCSFRTS